ncbi:hypothetical protein GCM10027417_22340 [Glutamicibacter endophyticus]
MKNLKRCNRVITGAIATIAAIGLVVPSAALAAPGPDSSAIAYNATLKESSAEELARVLEDVFTDAIVLGDSGIISIDQNELTSILGEKEAGKVIAALSSSRELNAPIGAFGVAKAAAGRSFVDCMIDSSVLGFISGMSSGIYAELIRKKEFYELAQRIMPRLIKAGVGGGIAGIVGGLAVSAIVCSRE